MQEITYHGNDVINSAYFYDAWLTSAQISQMIPYVFGSEVSAEQSPIFDLVLIGVIYIPHTPKRWDSVNILGAIFVIWNVRLFQYLLLNPDFIIR